MENLIKISNNENKPIIWTNDKIDIVRNEFPDVYIPKYKYSNGVDTDQDCNFMAVGFGNAIRFNIVFLDKILFIRCGSGCLSRYLNYYHQYTLEDYYCQLRFGDRNLRPIDPDTSSTPKFQGMLKGYHTSSDRSSASKKVNRNFIWTPETWDRNKIISAANMKLGKYAVCKLYFAYLNDTNLVKLGFTSLSNVHDRMHQHRAENYVDIIEIAEGNGDKIIKLERDIKLKFNLCNELFDKSIYNEILDFAYNYDKSFKFNLRENIDRFICK